VISLWPHALLVGLVALASVRVRSRTALLFLALGFTLSAVLIYWHLDNGVSPPRGSGRTEHMVALGFASLVPLVATAIVAHALRKHRFDTIIQVLGATVVGLLLIFFIPGIQIILGCSFTGICP
jgi:hypothetical protein